MNEEEVKQLWDAILELANTVGNYRYEQGSEFATGETIKQAEQEVRKSLQSLEHTFMAYVWDDGVNFKSKKKNPDIDTLLDPDKWEVEVV